MNDSKGFKSEFRIFWRIIYLLLLLLFMMLPVVFVITKPYGVNLPMAILFSALSTFILWLWVKYFKRTYCRWQVINNELHLTYWNSAVVIPVNKIDNFNSNASISITLLVYFISREEGIEVSYEKKKYFIAKGDFCNSGQLCRYLEMKVNGKVEKDFQISKPQFDFNEKVIVLNCWGIFNFETLRSYSLFIIFLIIGFIVDEFSSLPLLLILTFILGFVLTVNYSNFILYNSVAFQLKNVIFRNTTTYLFDDVKEISIHTPFWKETEVLEIILKDYTTRTHNISSLGLDDCKKFISLCESKGIIVKGSYSYD